MLQVNTLPNNKGVAVSWSAYEIYVRDKGKANYGKEKPLVVCEKNKLVIDAELAKKYGMEIEIKGGA